MMCQTPREDSYDDQNADNQPFEEAAVLIGVHPQDDLDPIPPNQGEQGQCPGSGPKDCVDPKAAVQFRPHLNSPRMFNP